MTARVTFHDHDEAQSTVQTLQVAGYDAGSSKERAPAEAGGEETVYVVHTDAPPDEIDDLVADSDAFVEVMDPTTGAVAPITQSPDGDT